MRVKNLLIKGPVQILSLFVMRQTMEGGKGREILGSLAKLAGPGGEARPTTLGNRKPKYVQSLAIFI